MTKHKKRRSIPTPDPDDSIEKDLPETEKVPNPSSVDKKPETERGGKDSSKPNETAPVTAEYKKKLDTLFWLRIGLAVIAGVAATFIFESIEGEERRWASIGFMIILFIATIIIGKGMKMQLPSSDRKKLVTQGIGSYIFLYLFMWIVSYTLIHISEDGFIPSPIS